MSVVDYCHWCSHVLIKGMCDQDYCKCNCNGDDDEDY